jgi:cobalamin biosynthesis protein CobD/CbiB
VLAIFVLGKKVVQLLCNKPPARFFHPVIMLGKAVKIHTATERDAVRYRAAT